jgi:hypothetical protein
LSAAAGRSTRGDDRLLYATNSEAIANISSACAPIWLASVHASAGSIVARFLQTVAEFVDNRGAHGRAEAAHCRDFDREAANPRWNGSPHLHRMPCYKLSVIGLSTCRPTIARTVEAPAAQSDRHD